MMSFFQKGQLGTVNIKYKQQTTFLQTYLNHKHHKLLSMKKHVNSAKKMSLFISPKKASITVEAAIAVPIFLFAIINLLSITNIIRLYSNVEMTLHQTGKEMAIYAYAYDKIVENDSGIMDEIGSIGFSNTYVREKVLKELNKEYLNTSPMVQGENGISLLQSKIMEDDIIDLVVAYRVKPTIGIIGFTEIPLVNRCRMRAWTGYDNTKGSNEVETKEEIVYVTETGTVYHTNRNCTHLILTVKGTSLQEISKLRNENGGKYYPCEICGGYNSSGTIFITEQGDRYHSSSECSGLKRTIFAISIYEIGNRKKCHRCSESGV